MTDTDPIPTEPVSEWERRVRAFLDEPVPEDVREHGARVVADVLCAAVAGAAEPSNASVARAAPFATGEATVLGNGRRVPPGTAALLNGVAAVTQEIEEGHDEGGHVGASIVVGGLVGAELADADGEELVAACVRSYELCVRLERAIFAMKDRINDAVPWLVRDPHSTWTTVGPAVTAAQCLGADERTLGETVRVAANLAVVSMHDPYAEGSPARNYTAGFSAQVGVDAALATLGGLRGSAAAVERVYDPLDELLDGEFTDSFRTLGDEWEVTRSYFKPYPSCRYTHPPLDALRDAVDGTGLAPDDVESIRVYTFENATDVDHATPETLTGAKFSTPYVLARYVHDGAVRLEHFTPERVRERPVRALARRVSLHLDAEFEREFPGSWGARVEVETGDRTLVGERAFPRGDHRDPLDEDAFRDRSRALLSWGLPAEQVDAALEAAFDVRNRTVAEVVTELTA